MPKQKVRQSVETETADKAVEPAPALCDDMPDDFMAFVRLELNAVNTKLDNIVTLQSSMEKKRSAIDDLTRFNKITIQGTPQMAVDKEAICLSRVYSYYYKCNLPLFYV